MAKDVHLVTRYSCSEPDQEIEELADLIECDERVASVEEILPAVDKVLAGEALNQLQIYGHTNEFGELVFEQASATLSTVLQAPSKALEDLATRFSRSCNDSWRVGLWGCETGRGGYSTLTGLATLLRVPVAGYRYELDINDFSPLGLLTKYGIVTATPSNDIPKAPPDSGYRWVASDLGISGPGATCQPPWDPDGTVRPIREIDRALIADLLDQPFAQNRPVVETSGLLAAPGERLRGRDGYLEILMGGRLARVFLEAEPRRSVGLWFGESPAAGDALRNWVSGLPIGADAGTTPD
jgi:hypothetical protein